MTNTASAALPPGQVVHLLLHGTASGPSTWDDLVDRRFGSHCPVTTIGEEITAESNCYRHQFADRIVDGYVWSNGDGSTFEQLGEEVGLIVDQIARLRQPKAIILVGHSRGALAARAYLQSFATPPPYRIGLLTIGAPHQGTPFGRVQYWLRHVAREGAGYEPEDLLLGNVLGDGEQTARLQALLFSPASGYVATAHQAMRPVRNEVSEAIWALNDGTARLGDNAQAFAQIHADGLRLGQDTPVPLAGGVSVEDDILDDDSILARLLIPGDFVLMRQFVLGGTGRLSADGSRWRCLPKDRLKLRKGGWACNGDSIVPAISQRLDKLPGFSVAGKPFHRSSPGRLHQVHHADETGQVLAIAPMLKALRRDLRK